MPDTVATALHDFIDWQSTRPEAICLSQYHSTVNGHTAIYEFLKARGVDPAWHPHDWVAELPAERTVNFPPDFSIIEHEDEVWVLPLTAQGHRLAARIIPTATRRFGSHYILCGAVGHAIATSLRKAGAA